MYCFLSGNGAVNCPPKDPLALHDLIFAAACDERLWPGVLDNLLRHFHALHAVLGIFIPLIVTNCIVLARVEAFAAKNDTVPAALDGFMMGFGLALVLAVLGGIREVVGKGTLLSGLDLALGPAAKQFVVTVVPNYHGFLLAVLPPGAFIGLALLIAGKSWLEQRKQAREQHPDLSQPAMVHGH